ncbi:MAG: PKD domain-containing protein, partial [Thermoplasmata archaeon]
PVTGIGSPIVDALLPDLATPPGVISSLGVDLNASATSGVAPLDVTFSVRGTGGSGQYPVRGVYFGDGTAAFAIGGIVNHTYSTTGVYSVQAYVVDGSGNFSISLPSVLVVGRGSALSANLSVSNPSPAVDAQVTFTGAATGGTAPYSYLYYFGDGTYQNWTNASSVEHTYGASGSFCAEVAVRDAADAPDGGSSAAVPVAVGPAPAPDCTSSSPYLEVGYNASAGIRDAPAEFPSMFTVSGGRGTVSEQYTSTDPYVSACGCEVFRSPGDYSVWLYANESAGPSIVAETNVTVTPPLNGTFTASPTFGPAPLSADFGATVSGGYEADSGFTSWTFGNGQSAVGATASEVYRTAGTYWAVGQLSDHGHGNTSEAFLIDVGSSAPSAPSYVAAAVAPAVDLPSGSTVHYSAAAYSASGTRTEANFTWRLGSGVAGYSPELNRTYYAPPEGAATFSVTGNLSVNASGGGDLTTTFGFAPFFAVEPGGFVPRANGLVLTDTTGPASGPPPLAWAGTASVRGPGTIAVSWTFGDGASGSGTTVTHEYTAVGEYSEVVRATDSWGDVAVDAAGVDVAVPPPFVLNAGPSVDSGVAPLTVYFAATASGGTGGPFTYLWQFGDGASAGTGNTSHTYERAGTYTANITARDPVGSAVNRSYTILVSAPASGGRPVLGFLPGWVSLGLLVIIGGIALGAVLAIAARRPPPATRGPPTP